MKLVNMYRCNHCGFLSDKPKDYCPSCNKTDNKFKVKIDNLNKEFNLQIDKKVIDQIVAKVETGGY